MVMDIEHRAAQAGHEAVRVLRDIQRRNDLLPWNALSSEDRQKLLSQAAGEDLEWYDGNFANQMFNRVTKAALRR